MKILLVDDDPFILRLLTRQLSQLGFHDVSCCGRARDAIAVLEADLTAVGLVVCDLQMPEMDGVEFLRHLAGTGYAGELVLTSGEGGRVLPTAERLARAHQLNVRGIVQKPISLQQLQALLGTAAACAQRPSPGPRTEYSADALRLALECDELVNYYQPKVELSTGRLIGVETLVRWRHPEAGLVFPDQFIATAEANGLIDDLTRNVLSAALRQTRAWHDAGLPLRVAVNISMDNLVALDFPDFVERSVTSAGLPMSSVVLEVTESRLMKNPVAPLDILTRLRLKRVGLSIDDFGTGHSSLAQLRDIPFDELKVDRGFVHGASRDASLRAIVEASLEMAHQLGLTTVGEGVEDPDDWEFLRKAGCDHAQGYFVAKPMPAEDVAAWAADWDARRQAIVASG